MKKIRTIKSAAAYYRQVDPGAALTETAIRSLLRTGRVPCSKVGRKYLVSIEALDAYLTGTNAESSQPHSAPKAWVVH